MSSKGDKMDNKKIEHMFESIFEQEVDDNGIVRGCGLVGP